MDESLPLTECDQEPIHIPGAVQPHGALLAVDPATWRVTHASANLAAFVGTEAIDALGHPLTKLFGEDVTALLRHDVQARRGNPGGTALDAGTAGGRLRLIAHTSRSAAICIDLLRETLPASAEPALTQAQRVIQSLRLSRTSAGLCSIAVNEIRRITGYDRVMVYRFDEDGSGEVIAEDHSAGIDSFMGLKYPAADIPQQARRLYLVQRVRIIPDVDAEPAPLLAMAGSRPADIDLSLSSIRAVSPVHLQYLRNMGVTATAVASLIVSGRLWGTLVCHHNSPRQVTPDMRALFDLVGQVMSVMLGSLAESGLGEDRLRRHRALGAITAALAQADAGIAEALSSSAGELVKMVPADGAVVMIDDRTVAVGRTPEPGAFRTILAALNGLAADDVAATAALPAVTGDPSAPLDGFAGALLLPLPSCGNGTVVWFRKELAYMVNWAGNPAKALPDAVTGRLQPRESFAAWQEEVRGHAAAWTEADLGAARDLRRVVDEALVRRSESELLLRLRDTDPLTGLANRHAAEERLSAIAAVPPRSLISLVVINVDRFRKINESLGHAAGDALLVQIANRLRMAAGPGELVARLDGDEFLAINSDGTDNLAARMFAVFAQPFEIARRRLQVYASLGVADSILVGGDVTGLPRAAEAAMRESKKNSGNRVSAFVPALHQEASRQLLIEQSLDASLRSSREQFHLAFQPIVRVATGTLRSWEVLVRWTHPVLGDVPPGVFIPIAEGCGLIAPIGDMIMDEALRYLVETPPSADAEEQDVYLSVNVSPLQLTRQEFAGDIAAKLDALGIVPSRLCIEITEGVFTDKDALAIIAETRRLGVRVAVDDFGVGYSSLSSLQRLPADVVKLDRSFVPAPEATMTPGDLSFLSAVVTLAHTAGLAVVIEGVETQAQLDAVVLAGVDAIQGYYLARPMPGEAAVATACQAPGERGWDAKLDAARRFASGSHVVAG
jgi:diguanylate cyclase (GGDEF)-like protein